MDALDPCGEFRRRVLATPMHDRLLALQEASDRHHGTPIMVDGQDGTPHS